MILSFFSTVLGVQDRTGIDLSPTFRNNISSSLWICVATVTPTNPDNAFTHRQAAIDVFSFA